MNGGGIMEMLGTLSPEERAYIMKHLTDLTGAEEGVQQQQALARQLRVPLNTRMDAGSQIGRAASGIGSAIGTYGAEQARGDLGAKYKGFGEGWAALLEDIRRRKQFAELAGMTAGQEDVWGRS